MNGETYVDTASPVFIGTCDLCGDYNRGVPSISGKRIIELRVRAGFETQGALAVKAKLDPSKLSRLENDKPVNLTLKTLERLAKTLKVSPGDLFSARPEGKAGHGESSGGVALADSLRGAIAEHEKTGQFPGDWRGDIMLAIFTLTRALQRPPASADNAGRSPAANE